jgi:phenylacetate-CoA ligase
MVNGAGSPEFGRTTNGARIQSMRLQDFISAKLYYPLLFALMSTPKNPIRWRVRRMTREMERLMRQPLAEIKRRQAKRVHELLVYAARHCEFYRARFARAGLTDERDLTVENLEWLPVLTKEEVQQHFESLLASDVSRITWRQNSSGGSTGQTVVLMQDAAYREEGDATGFVSDRMQGWGYGNRVAWLWGGPGDTRTWRNTKVRILSYLSNCRLYDSFDMSAANMDSYHRDLERYQPDNIVAYAGSAYLFARFLLEQNLKPQYPRVSIITSAETLTDEMRATIEQCFRVPVYNRYGSREVGCVGSECSPRSGLHLQVDKVIEVLDSQPGRPVVGAPGRIIVTLLSNRALPLIRYDLGDIGILAGKPCTCGVNTPLLERVLGRTSDFIVAPSGRLIHGEYFTHVFYGRRAITQFQFVQESRTQYAVRIVQNGELMASHLDDIRQEIMAVLGSSADLRFEFPEHIPPLPSGKFRFTISNVKPTLPV